MVQTAIVTGASRGIGQAVAEALAVEGIGVLLQGRDGAALAEVADRIEAFGGRAVVLAGDVADPATAAAAVSRAEAALGPVDILVNNAGMNLRCGTLDMDLADWQRVFDVNLGGTLHFCRAVLPGMIARRNGRIVNISSTASKAPHRNAAPAYGASKAAVNALTLHLAQEMAPHGIRVNAVCPGPVDTEMTADWSPAYRAEVLARLPMGRLGRPEAIAEAVLYLASARSDFVTGTTLDVNGGTLMG